MKNINHKILLTGGTGYIGSHMAVELINLGFKVIILDNLSESFKSVINNIEEITKTKVSFENCDVNNTKDLNYDKKIVCPHCEYKEKVIENKNE